MKWMKGGAGGGRGGDEEGSEKGGTDTTSVLVCLWPERLGAVELSAVWGGEVTIDVLQHQVLDVTEHIAQVPANKHTHTHIRMRSLSSKLSFICTETFLHSFFMFSSCSSLPTETVKGVLVNQVCELLKTRLSAFLSDGCKAEDVIICEGIKDWCETVSFHRRGSKTCLTAVSTGFQLMLGIVQWARSGADSII